jgi:hypothetical protein
VQKTLFFFLILLITCKPVTKKGIEDSSWQEESIKIASDLCGIYEKCSEDSLKDLPDPISKQAKEEISPNNCIEKNKKSNVYQLKVNDVEGIKHAYRECGNFVRSLSCDEITSGKIQTNSSCKIISLAMKKN